MKKGLFQEFETALFFFSRVICEILKKSVFV